MCAVNVQKTVGKINDFVHIQYILCICILKSALKLLFLFRCFGQWSKRAIRQISVWVCVCVIQHGCVVLIINNVKRKSKCTNRCMTLNSHFKLSAATSICFIASFSLINNKYIRMHTKESIYWMIHHPHAIDSVVLIVCSRFFFLSSFRIIQLSLKNWFLWKQNRSLEPFRIENV